jgi:2-polyprenyl-3-methyl-5-hydroxy-6-metoxy-1,4-benzoquinol methylase
MKNHFLSIDIKSMRNSTFIKDNLDISRHHYLKVDSNNGFAKRDSCPVCSSTETTVFTEKEGISHFECSNCHCCYPEYIPNDVNDIYSDDEYVNEFNGIDSNREEYKKTRFGKERLNLIKSRIGTLQGKSIMDIGCGTGWFLDLCKENGMDCWGQELGTELAKQTSKRLNIEVISLPVNEIITKDNSFDVIVMFDLIEHLTEPVDFVKHLKRLLKKDGIMLILTPNFDSFGIKKLRSNSSLVMPTDHLCIFSEKSVKILSDLVGMNLEYLAFSGIDIGDYLAYLEYSGKIIDDDLKQVLYDDIQPVLDQFSFSNHMRFILKK